MTRTALTRRRTLCLLAVASLVVPAVIAVGEIASSASGGTATPHTTATDFTGHWTTTSGGWTVTSEAATGACTGTSDFAGYGFSSCQVTGSTYAFDVTDGPSYTSHNTGTITGNTISDGNFNDGSGNHAYTATRDASGPGVGGGTSTPTPSGSASPGGKRAAHVGVVCNTPANPGQSGSCTATVGDASGSQPLMAPTGAVTMTATQGYLGGSQCTLAASATAPLAPSCTLPYLPPAGGLPAGTAVPVSASYAGDATFNATNGSAQLMTASLGGTDDPLAVCNDGAGGCDGYDESFPADPNFDSSILSALVACAPSGGGQTAQIAHVATADSASCQADLEAIVQSFQQEGAGPVAGTTAQTPTPSTPQQIQQEIAAEAQKLEQIQNKLSQQQQQMLNDLRALAKNIGSLQSQAGTFTAKAPVLNIKAALAAVLMPHPTKAQVTAFDNAIVLASATKASKTRALALATLLAARTLGYRELVKQLHGKGGKLPKVVLGSAKATIASGKTAAMKITLTAIDQRLLRVLFLMKAPAAHHVTVTTTITRAGHTRKGTAAIAVKPA